MNINSDIQNVIEGRTNGCVVCGDSLEIMKDLPIGCVITDPPFNIGFSYETYNDALTDIAYQELLRLTCPPPCVIIHYPEDMFVVSAALAELPEKCAAWVYHANTARQWRMVGWFGCEPDFSKVKQPYRNPNDSRVRQLVANGSGGASSYDWWEIEQVKNICAEKTEHPCQMPLEVMLRVVGVTPEPLIIDPFCGSGTTLVAAKKLGRRWIGIDISEKYCEIARNRIRDTERPLFAPPTREK